MIKKLTVFVFILFYSLTVGSIFLNAQETQEQKKSAVEEKIKEYEKKLEDLRSQKGTLSSQIQYMDTQVFLTELKVQEAEKKVESTQKEIDTLGTRIEGLDSSLNYLSESLLERVSTNYKNRSSSVLDLMLDSNNANDFMNRFKYHKTTQNNNQKVLLQVQETKLNFEEQKKLRVKKKTDLDKMKVQLADQKVFLTQQKKAKESLLVVTRNDEQTYQRLLESAKAQLNAFKSFSSSAGANTIGSNQFGSGSDGNYYSQRDSRWASNRIGSSPESILDVGCLLTSIAMVGKKYGANVSPVDIASDSNRFFGNTAYMNNPWPGVAGKTYRRVAVSDVGSELDGNNYVIVGVKRTSCAYGGDHFVVLTKKDGDGYIMHDPIYGPDKKFSDHYSTICSAGTYK